jgi:transcriptional regulator with XRE-family HTH domain
MNYKLKSSADVGHIVRAVRIAQAFRQDEAAETMGVSENFLGKVERGGETVQWGKLFQVLENLGIEVVLQVPDFLEQDVEQAMGRRRKRVQ